MWRKGKLFEDILCVNRQTYCPIFPTSVFVLVYMLNIALNNMFHVLLIKKKNTVIEGPSLCAYRCYQDMHYLLLTSYVFVFWAAGGYK